jgi:hypothetical protein
MAVCRQDAKLKKQSRNIANALLMARYLQRYLQNVPVSLP